MSSANGTRDYAPEDIQRGLQAVVVASGNTRRAAEVLKQAGYRRVPASTLHRWVTSLHQDRYRELQREMRAELNSRMADEHEALARAYAELEWKILSEFRDKIPGMKGGELAQAANKFAIASAVKTDKARLYRAEPTEIRRNQDISDLLKILAAPKFAGVVSVNTELLEATAEEIPDAQPENGS